MVLAQFAHSRASGTSTASGRTRTTASVIAASPPTAPSSHASSDPSPTTMRRPWTASVQATARMPPSVS